jgi:hypothetical protein
MPKAATASVSPPADEPYPRRSPRKSALKAREIIQEATKAGTEEDEDFDDPDAAQDDDDDEDDEESTAFGSRRKKKKVSDAFPCASALSPLQKTRKLTRSLGDVVSFQGKDPSEKT